MRLETILKTRLNNDSIKISLTAPSNGVNEHSSHYCHNKVAMLRWLDPRRASEPPDHHHHLAPRRMGEPDGVRLTNSTTVPSIVHQNGHVTDDPLAILDNSFHRTAGQRQIYSVSRSVFLPRVVLKNSVNSALGSSGSGLGSGG